MNPSCGERFRQFPDGFLRILTDHWDGLCGGDVIAGAPLFITRDTGEVLFNKLLFSARADSVRTLRRLCQINGAKF